MKHRPLSQRLGFAKAVMAHGASGKKGARFTTAILFSLRSAAALAAGVFTLGAFFYYGRLYPADSPLEDPIFYPLSVVNAVGIAWGVWYLTGIATRQWTTIDGDR